MYIISDPVIGNLFRKKVTVRQELLTCLPQTQIELQYLVLTPVADTQRKQSIDFHLDSYSLESFAKNKSVFHLNCRSTFTSLSA